MKRIPSGLLGALCTALILLSPGGATAQNAKPPTQLTYQGFLTDGNGLPFGSTAPVNKTITFRIYDALTGGTLKWSSQQVITVDKGYFSALLGQGSAVGSEPFTADLTGIFTGTGASDRYLELSVDDTTIAPRLRFLAAPYAMLAKSATELVDPVTGASSLFIASGSLGGNGANLTNLNASQIASGTLAVARIPSLDASQIGSGTLAVARIPSLDASQIGSGTLAAARIPSLDASQIGSGTLANGRTTASSANTANAIVARDASGSIAVNQVVANSFKITGTQTLVLSSISRGSLYNDSPMAGVTQTRPHASTDNGRQNAGDNSNWWKSTQTSWGTLLYTGTFVVPDGELWEVAYTCQYYWNTDDWSSIVWSQNDALLPDDAVITSYKLGGGAYMFNQTFILPSGTHVLRVKGIIGGGSNTDYITFPWHSPSHFVLRKYKSN